MQVIIFVGEGTSENRTPSFGKTRESHSGHEKRSTKRNQTWHIVL